MKKKTGFYTGCHRFDHALSPMADGAVTYAYDAWGALRNPSTGEAYDTDAQPELLLGRGYTGHEHLPEFGLVNMNARLYDPALGRFLNPDPEVQLPDNTQSYNRYTYCVNNPLRYADPTGEVIRTYVNGKPYDYKMGKDGTFGFYNNADELYDDPNSFVFDLTMALQEIQSGDFGKIFISDLINSENIVNVEYLTGPNSFNPNNDTACWNPQSDEGGISMLENGDYSTSRPPYIGLGHELAHAADKFYGKYDESAWFHYLDKMIDRTEIYACQVENMLRFDHNIPLRTHYAHSGVNVIAPVDFSAIPIYNSIYYRPKPYYPIYLNVF